MKKRGGGGLNKKKKTKKRILIALATAIKKDPSTSIRKHANELKVHEKIVRTAVKQYFSPNFNFLDYAIWGVLENKTNATSHPNILVRLRLLLRRNGIKYLKILL